MQTRSVYVCEAVRGNGQIKCLRFASYSPQYTHTNIHTVCTFQLNSSLWLQCNGCLPPTSQPAHRMKPALMKDVASFNHAVIQQLPDSEATQANQERSNWNWDLGSTVVNLHTDGLHSAEAWWRWSGAAGSCPNKTSDTLTEGRSSSRARCSGLAKASGPRWSPWRSWIGKSCLSMRQTRRAEAVAGNHQKNQLT